MADLTINMFIQSESSHSPIHTFGIQSEMLQFDSTATTRPFLTWRPVLRCEQNVAGWIPEDRRPCPGQLRKIIGSHLAYLFPGNFYQFRG
jgi:hypothetical protein